MKNELPFGTQFSPTQINNDLSLLLKIIEDNEGDDTSVVIDGIIKNFFSTNAPDQQRTMANNCKNSLVAYGVMESGGGVHLTEFGRNLNVTTTADEQYDMMAKHILLNLNGMVLIDVLRTMHRNVVKPTNESVNSELSARGFSLAKTSNNVQVMKLWLEKAHILNGWRIDEDKLSQFIELSESEFELLKELRAEQYYFLKALCNTASDEFQKASDIRGLASATYGFVFQEKSFSSVVLNPLEEKGLIQKQKTTGGRGGSTPLVKVTDLTKKEIIIPLLSQVENMIGKEVAVYFQKPLADLRKDIDSTDTYVKGIALEAFAIKVMRIIGLDFIQTRLKGSESAGAEVDVLFDSSRLLYSRWQVQCKNTQKVSLDQIAKEVGLSHVLKTNAIVIMTTGKITDNAREYATQIMKSLNLCIILLEGPDIDAIIEEPAKIVNIFNRESLNAKHIKVFEV